MERDAGIEGRIREIGFELYNSMNEVPPIFDRRRWKGRVMEWAMKDEGFKSDLFRYIDVLPSLKNDRLAVRLLNEYFSDSANLPLILRQGMKRASRGVLPYAAGAFIRAAVKSLAGEFIAGRNSEEAAHSLGRLWKDGLAGSVDLLGEEALGDRETEAYTERYLRLIDLLAPEAGNWKENPILEKDTRGNVPRFDISLKVSSFYSRLDPIDWDGSLEGAKKNLRRVIAKARDAGASVCFDMEHYYCKDLIVGIFKSVLDEFEYSFGGIALQAYLKDTKEDTKSLIEWARESGKTISVRLVKGAYWDYEVVANRQKGWPIPVFTNKDETDRNFEALTIMLLENTGNIRPAIATHNIRSISNAIACAERLGLPKEALEFQMLYGMAVPLRNALRRMGYRVRVYTPVGELIPGMGYLVRRLLENTSNASFLRGFFAENRPFEELMQQPAADVISVAADEGPGDIFRNEPTADFSRHENRAKMKEALSMTRHEYNTKYPLYIGGEKVMTERELLSVDPADPRDLIGRVSCAGTAEAEKAIAEAKKAWVTWRMATPETRAGHLFSTAKIIRKKRFELAALEVREVGKTWKDADGDVTEAIDYLEYYGREMLRLGKAIRLGDYPAEVNDYGYVPKGIGVVISPWNFPLAIPAGMVSAGIVTGNCVLFKPSSLSPVTGWALVDAFMEAGLPQGVLQFLPGHGAEVGEYLVSHKDLSFAAFTGSKDIGLRIVRLAAETATGQKNVKKVVSEMGGKNAIIVDETAELDETVKGVTESAFGYQGQKCSACSRVIVVGEVFDEFCERLRNAVESIPVGPPENPAMLMGPVIAGDAFRKISGYIEMGARACKEVSIKQTGLEGNFVGPVILVDIDQDSPLAQEEIFGPVLSVLRAKDIDEALEKANNSIYALTGGIFSRSPENIRKARERFEVGNLYINRKITGALVGRQPFGGAGMSGVGSKAGGPDYLLQFMNPRSISENTMRRGFAPPNIY